jgi:hypothetical protein
VPYIAVDLDAFDDAQAVAGATGLLLPQVLGGLALMWRWCWRNKADRVTAEQLPGWFGFTAPGLAAALVAFGFLEAGESYRVRGVARYLRLSEVRARAGRARTAAAPRAGSGQLLPSTQPAHAGQPASTPPAADQPFQRASNSEQRRAKKRLAGSAGADPQAPLGLVGLPGASGPPPPLGDDTADDAYKQLVDELFRAFKADRGVDPSPSGRDWKALARLRARHEPAEILRRFRIGVVARYAARCSTYVDLEQRWDACAQPEPTAGPGGVSLQRGREWKQEAPSKVTERGILEYE